MKYIYEFIGTFFLVLTVGMTVLNPHSAGDMAPLAIGAVLMCLVFAGGHVSGAHYNPAVSFAALLRGKLTWKEFGLYSLTQLFAAICAAFLTIYLKGEAPKEVVNLDISKAFLVEILFTFALCYVILNVAMTKETKGNSYFGLAIGFIVTAGAYAVGAVSSAAFNPAVALGITIMNFTAWSSLWMFFAANLIGGALAAWVTNMAHKKA